LWGAGCGVWGLRSGGWGLGFGVCGHGGFHLFVFNTSGHHSLVDLLGYLAHKKTPTPVGPLLDPRHRPTVGS
jgi:hypothetical protein